MEYTSKIRRSCCRISYCNVTQRGPHSAASHIGQSCIVIFPFSNPVNSCTWQPITDDLGAEAFRYLYIHVLPHRWVPVFNISALLTFQQPKMDRHLGVFADQVPAVFVGIAVLSITLVGARYLGYRSLNRFPLIGSQYGSYPKRLMAYVYHAETLYREGYAKFRSAAYRMTTADGASTMLQSGARHDWSAAALTW